MPQIKEVYFSVDVEASGPIPGEYSMLTIGACKVDQPDQVFSCEIKPTTNSADPDAMKVTGLSLEKLALEGLSPDVAMRQFQEWIEASTGPGNVPVFVGLNAPFDWSFINYYFHRYLGSK